MCYNTNMFTGIVEETGILKSITGSVITVQCKKVLEGTKIGDSIAINGCCETVTALTAETFSANVSDETFKLILNL